MKNEDEEEMMDKLNLCSYPLHQRLLDSWFAHTLYAPAKLTSTISRRHQSRASTNAELETSSSYHLQTFFAQWSLARTCIARSASRIQFLCISCTHKMHTNTLQYVGNISVWCLSVGGLLLGVKKTYQQPYVQAIIILQPWDKIVVREVEHPSHSSCIRASDLEPVIQNSNDLILSASLRMMVIRSLYVPLISSQHFRGDRHEGVKKRARSEYSELNSV